MSLRSFLIFTRTNSWKILEKLMNHLPDDSLSYRFKVWIMVSSGFFQRKAEYESEIWSDTFGYVYYEAGQIQASECISECHDEFNDIVPHEKRNWILYEDLFVNELFEEYLKHIRKLSAKEFNSHCKQAERGFWYYHWLAKARSFCCSIHK